MSEKIVGRAPRGFFDVSRYGGVSSRGFFLRACVTTFSAAMGIGALAHVGKTMAKMAETINTCSRHSDLRLQGAISRSEHHRIAALG